MELNAELRVTSAGLDELGDERLLITLLVHLWFGGFLKENANPGRPGNSKTNTFEYTHASEIKLNVGLCVTSAGRDELGDQRLLITLLVPLCFGGFFKENVNPGRPANNQNITFKYTRAGGMDASN
jgi:hypothetical protein